MHAVAARIVSNPVDVGVLSPDPAVLECTAQGLPPPVLTWVKEYPNGTTVEFMNSTRNVDIITWPLGENVTSVLIIDPTDPLDAANYTCQAVDMFGNVVISTAARVTVFGEYICSYDL